MLSGLDAQGTPRRRLLRKSSMEAASPGGMRGADLGRESAVVPGGNGDVAPNAQGRDSALGCESSRCPGSVRTAHGNAGCATQSASPVRMSGGGALVQSTAGQTRASRGSCIVSGFGAERVVDIASHERRRDAEALGRAHRRREEFTRGRMTTFNGEDLDRSAGGPWRANR